jgi:PAP2 superfamily
MAFVADRPLLNQVLALAYVSAMPQMVVLLLWLGARGQPEDLYGLALALAYGAVITLAVWTPFPSFGAFSVFSLPDDVASKLNLVAGFDYAHDLVEMLKSGPGFISPSELRGIVGFPSYHTLQALVLAWYGWRIPALRWPILALNVAVLMAIPIQGGHHLVDMLGGIVVAVVAVVMARATVAAAARSGAIALAPAISAQQPTRWSHAE